MPAVDPSPAVVSSRNAASSAHSIVMPKAAHPVVQFYEFDCLTYAMHNRQVILRRGASAVMLFALLVLPCLSLCSGWGGSAGMRMACCHGSAEHGSQTSADACCALGEQRQNAESSRSLLSVAISVGDLTKVAIAFLSTALTLQGSRFDIGEHDYVSATSDRHLLLSVFLI